jgi:hypothetical protein
VRRKTVAHETRYGFVVLITSVISAISCLLVWQVVIARVRRPVTAPITRPAKILQVLHFLSPADISGRAFKQIRLRGLGTLAQ